MLWEGCGGSLTRGHMSSGERYCRNNVILTSRHYFIYRNNSMPQRANRCDCKDNGPITHRTDQFIDNPGFDLHHELIQWVWIFNGIFPTKYVHCHCFQWIWMGNPSTYCPLGTLGPLGTIGHYCLSLRQRDLTDILAKWTIGRRGWWISEHTWDHLPDQAYFFYSSLVSFLGSRLVAIIIIIMALLREDHFIFIAISWNRLVCLPRSIHRFDRLLGRSFGRLFVCLLTQPSEHRVASCHQQQYYLCTLEITSYYYI